MVFLNSQFQLFNVEILLRRKSRKTRLCKGVRRQPDRNRNPIQTIATLRTRSTSASLIAAGTGGFAFTGAFAESLAGALPWVDAEQLGMRDLVELVRRVVQIIEVREDRLILLYMVVHEASSSLLSCCLGLHRGREGRSCALAWLCSSWIGL